MLFNYGVNTTYIFTGLKLAGNGAVPLVVVVDELSRSPLAIRVARSIDLEPLGARGIERLAVTIARSHVRRDGTQMIGRPLEANGSHSDDYNSRPLK